MARSRLWARPSRRSPPLSTLKLAKAFPSLLPATRPAKRHGHLRRRQACIWPTLPRGQAARPGPGLQGFGPCRRAGQLGPYTQHISGRHTHGRCLLHL